MKSQMLGEITSPAEVTHIDSRGFWLFVNEREYFLSYSDFPWFHNAKVSDILNVEFHKPDHLYWPQLDVDICLESIVHPENFPLIYK